MKDIYDYWIDNKEISVNEGLTEDLYEIRDNESMIIEVRKLIYTLNNSAYFKNGVMLYIFDNCLLTYEKYFKKLKLLLDTAISLDSFYAIGFISFFLASYQYSIEDKTYESLQQEVKQKFYDVFPRKLFYKNGIIYESDYMYINKYIEHCKNSDKLVKIPILKMFIPRFFLTKRNGLYEKLLDLIIECSNSLFYLVDYDYCLAKHIDDYERIIKENAKFSNAYKFEAVIKLEKKLDNKDVLKYDLLKYTMNTIIKFENQLIYEMTNSEKHELQCIASVNLVLDTLHHLNNFKTADGIIKEKIDECIRVILYHKRNFLKRGNVSDIEYFENTIEFPKTLVDNIRRSLNENLTNLYQLLYIDFASAMKEAIKNYADSPFIHLFSHVEIMEELGVYKYRDGFKNESLFSRFYNELGIKTQNELGELLNYFTGDFYLLMLTHLHSERTLSAQIIRIHNKDLIDNELISFIINDYFGIKKYDVTTPYILCVFMIINIEKGIYELIELYGGKFIPKKMEENLYWLFSISNNQEFQNMIMNVYYVLYAEYGMELRNNFMHGNIVNKNDLMIEVMYIFSSLLMLEALIYERKYSKGEEVK